MKMINGKMLEKPLAMGCVSSQSGLLAASKTQMSWTSPEGSQLLWKDSTLLYVSFPLK